MNARARRWGLLSAVVLSGTVLDQVTKHFANVHLRSRGLVSVIDGFVELRYARNPGAFFSLGAELPPDLRRVLLVGASLAASALILRLYTRIEENERVLGWALMLLLAGAVGNLIDRALEGEVVDFLHVYWRGVFDWATFNVADIFITMGLALLIVDMLLPRRAAARLPTPVPESRS